MNPRQLLLNLCLILLAAHALQGQQSAGNDGINASQDSCRRIRFTLSARERMRASGDVPGDDDFTAGAKACTRLDEALSTSDPGKIQNAANALRPILSRLGLPPSSPREQLAALERKDSGLKGRDLFYELPDLAKKAFNAGEMDKAGVYSRQLLQMAREYPKDWNYGNAIFCGNLVLGRVAAQRRDVKQAGQYLLAAGATPGSPQLDSFGPSMILAKELLEKGQSDVVLQYFVLCKKFWESGQRQLDEWSAAVRGGQIPNFGSNLNY
ncbi:MAG: hypothetical protein WAU58_11870 [Terriglobales bacterium]